MTDTVDIYGTPDAGYTSSEEYLPVTADMVQIRQLKEKLRSHERDISLVTNAFDIIRERMTDVEFCGFTKADILGWAEKPQANLYPLVYITQILYIYRYCLSWCPDGQSRAPPDTIADKTAAREAASPIDLAEWLWSTIYELRSTLLIATIDYSDLPPDSRIRLDDTIAELAGITLYIGRQAPTSLLRVETIFTWVYGDGPVRGGSQLLLSLLVLWHHTNNLGCRIRAAENLHRAIRVRGDMASAVCDEFKHAEVDGEPTWVLIAKAVRRDCLDERLLNDDLMRMIDLPLVTRNNLANDSATHYDKHVFLAGLAACRRQICRRSNDKSRWLKESTVVLAFTDTIISMLDIGSRETYVHAVIMSIATTATAVAATKNENYLAATITLVNKCIEALRRILRSKSMAAVSAELELLRKATRKTWLLTKDRLRAVLHTRNGHATTLYRSWLALGIALPLPIGWNGKSGARQEFQFPPLSRCAWSMCACSVYKPAHSLKVCTGCYVVAYCGKACREQDWSEGGHSTQCRRLGRGQ